MSNVGTISIGVRTPIIRTGCDLKNIVVDSLQKAVEETGFPVQDKDVICITESVVARTYGNYVSIDNIADDICGKFGPEPEIHLWNCIYSRNRFSMILKGIARAASKLLIYVEEKDEVGNSIENIFTGVNIIDYYREICESENCDVEFYREEDFNSFCIDDKQSNLIDCMLRPTEARIEFDRGIFDYVYTLADICDEVTDVHGFNCEYGLLGSNKATDDALKLFPRMRDCEELCEAVQSEIEQLYGKHVEVMVYGDGCFKDPVGGIWEFADPVVSPYYTSGLAGTPNEIKMKYVIDTNKEMSEEDFCKKITDFRNVEHEKSVHDRMGTTPRCISDLLGSLADLTSGSGDKGTPVIWIKNYFRNYAQQ